VRAWLSGGKTKGERQMSKHEQNKFQKNYDANRASEKPQRGKWVDAKKKAPAKKAKKVVAKKKPIAKKKAAPKAKKKAAAPVGAKDHFSSLPLAAAP